MLFPPDPPAPVPLVPAPVEPEPDGADVPPPLEDGESVVGGLGDTGLLPVEGAAAGEPVEGDAAGEPLSVPEPVPVLPGLAGDEPDGV